MKIPMNPINANAGQALRGGSTLAPCRHRMISKSPRPSAKRVKISVGGDISRNAAFVATNEIPHRTTATRAAIRGGNTILMHPAPQLSGYGLLLIGNKLILGPRRARCGLKIQFDHHVIPDQIV